VPGLLPSGAEEGVGWAWECGGGAQFGLLFLRVLIGCPAQNRSFALGAVLNFSPFFTAGVDEEAVPLRRGALGADGA